MPGVWSEACEQARERNVALSRRASRVPVLPCDSWEASLQSSVIVIIRDSIPRPLALGFIDFTSVTFIKGLPISSPTHKGFLHLCACIFRHFDIPYPPALWQCRLLMFKLHPKYLCPIRLQLFVPVLPVFVAGSGCSTYHKRQLRVRSIVFSGACFHDSTTAGPGLCQAA